jgi:hypothetical protein
MISKWYYSEFGQTKGPVSETKIVCKVLNEELELDTYITDDMDKPWRKIKDVYELMMLIHLPVGSEHSSEDLAELDNIYAESRPDIIYFHIPVFDLVVANVITSGLFQFYWLYRQWSYLNQKLKRVYGYKGAKTSWLFNPRVMFEKIENDTHLKAAGKANFKGAQCAQRWVCLGLSVFIVGFLYEWLSITSAIDLKHSVNHLVLLFTAGGTWLLALWSVLFLLPVQAYINNANKKFGNKLSKLGLSGFITIVIGLILSLPTLWFICDFILVKAGLMPTKLDLYKPTP